jgi:hypothetical protein
MRSQNDGSTSVVSPNQIIVGLTSIGRNDPSAPSRQGCLQMAGIKPGQTVPVLHTAMVAAKSASNRSTSGASVQSGADPGHYIVNRQVT